MTKKLYIRKLSLIGCLILVFSSIAILLEPVFEVMDDDMMRSVISGVYTGNTDGHVWYMFCPLTEILSLFYKYLGTGISWYGIFYTVIFIICGYVIIKVFLFELNEDNKKNKYLLLMLLAFILVILIYFYLVQQFTVMAGLLGSVAIFNISTQGKKKTTILLLVLCFLMRSNIFILLIPFVIVAKVMLVAHNESLSIKSIIKNFVPILILLISIIVVGNCYNNTKYSSSGWKEYKKMNEELAEVYDYSTFPFNEENRYQTELSDNGIDSSKYEIIRTYNLNLDHSIDVKEIHKVVEVVKSHEEQKIKQLPHKLKALLLKKTFLTQQMISAILYLVIIWMLIRCKKKLELFFLGCLFAGKWGIILYFCYIGRVVERVVSVVWFAELLLLVSIYYRYIKEIQWTAITKKIVYGASVVMILLALVVAGRNFKRLREHHQITESNVRIADYCKKNSDNYYFLDIQTKIGYTSYVFKENVSTDNLMYAGGWLVRTPLTEQKLKKLGGRDISEIIHQSPNVHYIVEEGVDRTWMETYFTERFGQCKMNIVDTFNGTRDTIYNVIQFEFEK